MASISFGALPCRGEKNLMTARVSMLLKSRASLTCFRACFLPGRALISTPVDVSYCRCQSHNLYNSFTLLAPIRFLLRLGWGFGCANLIQVGVMMMMIRLGFVLLIVVWVLLFRPTSQWLGFSRTVHFLHCRCHRRSVPDNRFTLTDFTIQFLYYPQILQMSRLLLVYSSFFFLFQIAVRFRGVSRYNKKNTEAQTNHVVWTKRRMHGDWRSLRGARRSPGLLCAPSFIHWAAS